MRKVFVSVYDAAEGMQMAETIFNDYGAIIVSENTILDEHLIRKLQNLNISKVKVFNQSDDIINANNSELYKAQYNANLEVMKDMLHDISSGKNINMERVDDVSESIFTRINENRDIVGCLGQIRSADEYTYTHSINVSLLSMLIGKWMKLDAATIKLLVQTGLLHDIGKTKINPEILNKPEKLSVEEFNEIRKHPVYGYRIIEKIPGISKDVCMGILMHHEREDGTGYPVGIKGNQIHKFAKIIAISDIYDAMTSNKSYREKEPPFEVFELMENKTFGLLDPTVVNAFLNNMAAYYIGDLVKLSNGVVGEIIYINPRHISQPVVRVNETFIDLTMHTDIKIVELV